MSTHDQLKNHLKNFTVKELKQEVINVKKGFQVSKLKQVDVENVILKNHLLFQHLLKKNKVKKTKPTVKKSNPSEKKPKPSVKNTNTGKKQLDKQLDDISKKLHINKILDTLDKIAAGKKYPEFIDEKNSVLTIQKSKSHYIIRDSNDFSVKLRATADRKQVEDFLYNILT